MQTSFPSVIAEMNPNWDPLTEHDLLHRSEDTSDSAEMVPSEEHWTTDEQDSDGEVRSRFPNIQRVVAVPARLTEDGGVEQIAPSVVISEAYLAWNQWDQDHWFAYRSDSDYQERACASTAVHTALSVSTKDSWEWRGACCLASASSSPKMSFYTYLTGRHLARLKGASNSQDLCDTRWTEEASESCDRECQELSILESTSSCISMDRRDSLQG